MVVSHIGVGILAIAISSVCSWELEKEQIIKPDESILIAGYDIKLKDMYIASGTNYLTRKGSFIVTRDEEEVTQLEPEVRFYPVEQSNTTESDIYYSLLSNLYIAMGDKAENGGYVVRAYHKPLVNLIWLGCVIMTLGGILGLFSNKKR
jgi:cytochrome c-type biogenesis protein CcmF